MRVSVFLFHFQNQKKAATSYGCLIISFIVRSWLAKKQKTVNVEEYLELVDHLRYVYIDDSHCPTVGDTIIVF